ncbi:MAG TPA: hypothetical protein VF103_17125 [Polyangiaceae bacterium]
MSDRHRDDDGVEELGDEIIVAQQTAAHAPAPRARVATDHPTVVISDVPGAPQKLPTVPPLRRHDRTEKTVVIRDRKSLDRLRREASRRPRSRSRFPLGRTLFLVGIAVLASLAAGTLLARFANSRLSGGAPSTATSVEAQGPSLAPTASHAAPEVVDLADLPVVKTKKKKKPSVE